MGRAGMRRGGAGSFATMMLGAGLLACAPMAYGQHTVRNLTGIVTDRQHEPLKGAVVEVDDGTTERVASYITGRNGQYSFKRLDGDTDYRVWATYRRHRSRTRSLSQFDTHPAKVINLVIKLQ